MPAALVRQRVRQRTRVDHALLDEDLTERAAHLFGRVSDLATPHIFFTAQVVEIATDAGYQIRQRKNSLAIALYIDILRCPLGNPVPAFSDGEFTCDSVSRAA